MTAAENIFIFFSIFLVVGTFLPLLNNKHWIIRSFDFARIQITVFLLLCLICSFVFLDLFSYTKIILLITLLGAILYQILKLYPYIYSKNTKSADDEIKSSPVKVLSINVYQDNDNYEALLNLVEEVKPDILLTMETDSSWSKGLQILDEKFTCHKKIALDNTYGMFFYSNLQVERIDVHYFLNTERPTLEAELFSNDGIKFTFFGFHPPPPSPTEEKTSKKKDGELMILANRIREISMPVMVAGDFNNVCWSTIAQLFAKRSQLIDARKGRGLYSTFPSKYSLLRIPIDLIYHSSLVVVNRIQTLKNIGSDHLPLLINVSIEKQTSSNKEKDKGAGKEERVKEIIAEGKAAERKE